MAETGRRTARRADARVRGISSRALLAAVVLVGLACAALYGRAAAPTAPRLARYSTLQSLTRYVDPLIGTFGNGNVFPGADLPFGMLQWSPDTAPSGITRPAGYFYRDPIITGFPLTHISGAGCVQYDDVPFMPTTRAVTSSPVVNGYPYSAGYSHADESAHAGYYRVRLNSGITVELSATLRTGIARFTYPHGGRRTLLINTGGSAGPTSNENQAEGASTWLVGRREVDGWAASGHFCGEHNRYTVYFAARFDTPFRNYGTWRGAALSPGARAIAGPRTGVWLDFAPAPVVVARVGISFVGIADARLNLEREDPGRSFDVVRRAADGAWNRALNVVQVAGPRAQDTVFYTALYHAMLHPNIFSDVNGSYRGFDGRVHDSGSVPQYANYSGWDIYRSEMPLLAWLMPSRASAMIQSLVRDAEQSGWLPKWPVANDDSGVMNGDPADPIIASARAFGARSFDARTALRAMIKGGTVDGSGPHGLHERPGLSEYLRLGYLPPLPGSYGSAATTLEYTTDDFSIAQLARSLHMGGVWKQFMNRSRGWRFLFNRATGFVEPAAADHSFPAGFSPTGQDGFVEGNAAQYTWMVPYDVPDLFRAMGGPARAIQRLNTFFLHLNTDASAPYDWAGNEPGLEVPWEYDFTSQPWRTQEVVRHIALGLYPDATYGLPGNDDLGTMSAWYVWASLGLYPEIPGVGVFAISTPLFRRIEIHRPAGSLELVAPGTATRPYIRRLTVGGRVWTRPWIDVRSLNGAGTVRADLASQPDGRWGAITPPPAFP